MRPLKRLPLLEVLLLRAMVLAALVFGAAGLARAAVEAGAPAAPSKRLAIVVGNSDYQSPRLEHLANAANDARRLSDSLKELNFEVVTGTDVSEAGFEALLDQAQKQLPSVSAVLIFYAGHGVQIGGENFLLPTDTLDPVNAEKLTERAVRLNDVIARFASRDRQTFVFLDACRNNPIAGASGVGNGLAQVEVGENTFIAFATQPGNVTADGAGDNSPFTSALLKNIEIPGLSISDMMIRVRNETEALTVGRQVPWDQSNLREQFYFTEQQVLDPAQLSASLSRILADPNAKAKLQTELASNDLQTAVLIVGQSLRSVELPPVGAADGMITAGQPAQAGVQVASLSAGTLEGARQSVATDIGTLIVGGGADDGAKAAELARGVQTELRRLGCYRMAVDGDWGKGSVRALNDFYRNTRQASATAEPTVDLLSDLFLRSGRVCKEPVAVKRTREASIADDGRPAKGKAGASRQGSGKSSGKGGRSAPARKPAAPPPDISGGIGIGGIF